MITRYCPQCDGELEEVRYPSDSMLNEHQFNAVRAGDFFCTQCVGTEAKTGYKYWWLKDLTQLKPDNAPTPTDPVLGAEQIAKDLIATWLSPFYSHGGIKDGIVLAINNERALLAQRDKRVEDLEKDRERLDFLETIQVCLDFPIGKNGTKMWTSYGPPESYRNNVRAAIDAAMKEPK